MVPCRAFDDRVGSSICARPLSDLEVPHDSVSSLRVQIERGGSYRPLAVQWLLVELESRSLHDKSL